MENPSVITGGCLLVVSELPATDGLTESDWKLAIDVSAFLGDKDGISFDKFRLGRAFWAEMLESFGFKIWKSVNLSSI